MSEDAAYKRIRAGRSARRFPETFTALADGRLHLATVVLLTPHLTAESVAGLIDAATHKTKAEIELLLAQALPAAGPGHENRAARCRLGARVDMSRTCL